MKPMVWTPNEHDKEVNAYLDKINHAPYEAIAAILLTLFCVAVAALLIGSF